MDYRTLLSFTAIVMLTAGCGPEERPESNGTEADASMDAGTGDDAGTDEDTNSGADAEPESDTNGTDSPDMEPDGSGGGTFEYPNGEPDPDTLYFKGTVQEGGFDGYEDEFDTWHTGDLMTCSYDGTLLSLDTGDLPNGGSFQLAFAVGDSPAYDLDPATVELDWSLSDGASAFFFWADADVEVESSGSVEFAECGETVAGTFVLGSVAEYHTVNSPGPWVADIEGAFHCTPTQPVDCGE